tara:strand:- start:6293 stop:7051 length:759 start_codon:yes stop_codon:yes gene_type:complete
MLEKRAIPVLLLNGKRLFKSIKFNKKIYVGDPINTIKLFNEKEVDEICILEIQSTNSKIDPDYSYIELLASQCYVPLSYGGGINTINKAKNILSCGVEKVVINSYATKNISFIEELSKETGSSSIIVSIDIKKNFFGKYSIYSHSGRRKYKKDIYDYIDQIQKYGAGEILINSINRDGMQCGYDIELIKKIAKRIKVPLIVCGGAGSLEDLSDAVKAGASAVAAGSLFVFKGPHRAVLINYPSYSKLQSIFK